MTSSVIILLRKCWARFLSMPYSLCFYSFYKKLQPTQTHLDRLLIMQNWVCGYFSSCPHRFIYQPFIYWAPSMWPSCADGTHAPRLRNEEQDGRGNREQCEATRCTPQAGTEWAGLLKVYQLLWTQGMLPGKVYFFKSITEGRLAGSVAVGRATLHLRVVSSSPTMGVEITLKITIK